MACQDKQSNASITDFQEIIRCKNHTAIEVLVMNFMTKSKKIIRNV